MKFITLDFGKSTCKTVDEQLTFAIMTAMHEPEHCVRWECKKNDASFVVSFSKLSLMISMSCGKDNLRQRLSNGLIKAFGKTRRSYSKGHFLNPSQIIHYLEWAPEACNEFRKTVGY